MTDRNSESRGIVAARALSLLRVMTGVIFLVAAIGKMGIHVFFAFLPLPVTNLTWQIELPARLAAWLAAHPTGALAVIVRDLFIPNGALVAGMVAWGQTIAGTLLVLGLYTTLASSLAILVAVTLAIAASVDGSIDARPYAFLIALSFAFIIGRAGETLGIDTVRRERRRHREF